MTYYFYRNNVTLTNWRNWGDHPIVVSIGALAALTALIVFITGRQTLTELLFPDSLIARPTLSTETPLAPTDTPTETPIPPTKIPTHIPDTPIPNTSSTSTSTSVPSPSPTETKPISDPTSTSSPAPLIETNLVRNGSFEEPFEGSGWAYDRQWKFEFRDGYNSNFSICSIQDDEPPTNPDGFLWVGLTQNVSVMPEKKYVFTAWLNWENTSQLHMKILWDNSSQVQVMQGTDGSSGGWVQQGGVVTSPPGVSQAYIMIMHGVINNSAKVPGSTVCIDNVVFE